VLRHPERECSNGRADVKQLPHTAYSFGFKGSMIGNVHFLAIPANASSKAGAQVLANFLLSPEAQARKADINV
jgi:putative thiamine transport system substrate-binding protein